LNKGLALQGTLPASFLFTGVDAEVQGAVASLNKLDCWLRGSHQLKSSSLTHDMFKVEKDYTMYHTQVLMGSAQLPKQRRNAKRQCSLCGDKSWRAFG
jgi:hypothetical protein